MGKGRAPCCEKVGLKKGSWTPAEDIRLISYIQKHGHGNWCALPKQAGLPRCGKSCRLRWINYLRPDIKRGNFTKEEEDAIIELHRLLGNKWSKIAARLPGRTDNEIKNVWNTHLKKRLSSYSSRGSPPESHASMSISSASNYNCITSNINGIEKNSHNWNSEEVDESIQASFDHINNVDIHNLPNIDGWDLAINEEESSCSLPTKHFSPSSSSLPPQINPSEEARIGLESNEMWIEYLEKELDLWGSS